MHATTGLLDAERATLFIYDAATDELWSKLAKGAGRPRSASRRSAGLAGAAFPSGEVLNIPDAYADPRFNPQIDRESGFRTRNMLCVPVIDRAGARLGVVQVLNKRGGPFTAIDIRRLKAFSAQIAVAIQNAQLFSDVLALKNYNESILKSLSNGVVTLDQPSQHRQGERGGGANPSAVARRHAQPPGRAGVRQPQCLGHAQPRIMSRGSAPATITPTPS